MGDLPPKLFFRIGEVAGLVGVEPHVLRYWEREFRSIRPTKSAKGQRVYSRKDVENLLRVRDLLYRDGFTIAGAKKKLQNPNAAVEHESEPESAPVTEVEVASTPEIEQTPPPISNTRNSTREKLLALRDEVEGFLDELSRR
jgi:DNA-binding transcriptional MerR regulator